MSKRPYIYLRRFTFNFKAMREMAIEIILYYNLMQNDLDWIRKFFKKNKKMKNNLQFSFIFLFSIISGNYSTDKNPSHNFTSKNFCLNAAGLIPAIYSLCIDNCQIQFSSHSLSSFYKDYNTDFLINSKLNSELTNLKKIIDSVFL